MCVYVCATVLPTTNIRIVIVTNTFSLFSMCCRTSICSFILEHNRNIMVLYNRPQDSLIHCRWILRIIVLSLYRISFAALRSAKSLQYPFPLFSHFHSVRALFQYNINFVFGVTHIIRYMYQKWRETDTKRLKKNGLTKLCWITAAGKYLNDFTWEKIRMKYEYEAKWIGDCTSESLYYICEI